MQIGLVMLVMLMFLVTSVEDQTLSVYLPKMPAARQVIGMATWKTQESGEEEKSPQSQQYLGGLIPCFHTDSEMSR